MAKILVADDEADLEMLIKQKFRKQIRENHYEFIFAVNGRDALEKLELHKDIDMLLSDINMPGMTGLELLKTIKSEYKELRVMMITAYGDEKNYKSAISIGADDFMTKPVDFNSLKNKVFKQ